MLRDAETTSIAERRRRPPLGGDTVPAAFRGGGSNNFFFEKKRKKENRWSSTSFGGRGTVSPPRGGRRIFSAVEVIFESRSTVHLTGRSRVFTHF